MWYVSSTSFLYWRIIQSTHLKNSEVENPFLFILLGVDTGEIDTLKSDKIELEESVAALQESVRSLQTEQRQIEDVEAKFQKRRVS